MPGINLGADTYTNAVATTGIDLTDTTFADAALTSVQKAISQIAVDRAQLGAVQSRLNFTNDQLSITKENLSSAISVWRMWMWLQRPLIMPATRSWCNRHTQMLTQANNLPNAALQLLRGVSHRRNPKATFDIAEWDVNC